MIVGEGWELNHVGLMVTNRDAALSHFQNLGVGVSVGPQPLLPHEDGQGSLTFYRSLKGDPVTLTYPTGGAHDFRDGESQIGDCQLECYAMRPGPGMFISEYLAEKGPGINHICFNAPEVEADSKLLLGKGCDLVFNATVNGRTVENYLDTREHGDLMISLRPPATDWEKAWKAHNEAHPLVPRWRFLGVGLGVLSVDASVRLLRVVGIHCRRRGDRRYAVGHPQSGRACGASRVRVLRSHHRRQHLCRLPCPAERRRHRHRLRGC